MAQHTPGPWVQGTEMDSNRIRTEGGNLIATAETPFKTYQEAYSNAQLMAAAPDMLTALEAWLAWDGEIRETPSPRIMAEAAIAKAKGE